MQQTMIILIFIETQRMKQTFDYLDDLIFLFFGKFS
jgi:hypothetical protein